MFQTKKLYIILFSLLFLVGCWDRNEISNVNFIMGIAVDITDDDKYRVTFQWALPSQFSTKGAQTGQENSENTIFSIEADSIPAAMAKLTEISPRTPIYSHMTLIVIGEDKARKGAKELFNIIDRQFEIRRTVHIVMAKGKGEEILRSKTPFETVQATGTDKIITRANRSSTFKEVTLNDFSIYEASPYSLSFMPIVDTISNTNLEQTTDTKNAWTQVNRMAFFNDYQLKQELSSEESKSWMYIMGEIVERTITEIEIDNKKLVTSSIYQSSNTKINVDSSQLSVIFSIKEQVSILGKPESLTTAETEEAIESYIKDELQETIKKMQTEKLDVFFLRTQIRQRYPKKWKEIKDNWPEIYADANIDIDVQVTVQHHNALRKEIKK